MAVRLLMRRHKISRAFTFDRHFEAAAFTTWP
jgi:predicted nucleic acid-binding protein